MSMSILVVDDHQIFRQGVIQLLKTRQDTVVVGEASNGRAALEAAAQSRPDVVLIDLMMPEIDGIDTTARLVKEFPGVQVVALSARCDLNAVRATLEAGASAYLSKFAAIDELSAALDALGRHEKYLGRDIAGRLENQARAANGQSHRPLSGRERELLQLLAEGKATKEAAQAMGVGVKTAETHRRSVMEKLQLYSVPELTKYAIREGLTKLDTVEQVDRSDVH